MEDTDYLLIVNHGPRPLDHKYGGKPYRIPCARHDRDGMFVPYVAAKTWYGDTLLRDHGDDMDLRFRTDEVSRISVRFGMLDAPFYANLADDGSVPLTMDTRAGDSNVTDRPYISLESLRKAGYEAPPELAEQYKYRHPNLPCIMAYRQDMETGGLVRWYLIIDDPYGEGDMAVTAARATDTGLNDLRAMIAAQQEQIAKLSGLLESGFMQTATGRMAVGGELPNFAPTPTAPQVADLNPLDPEVAGAFEAGEAGLVLPDVNEDVADEDDIEFLGSPALAPLVPAPPVPQPNPVVNPNA